jgi:riboflavin kinase / FMN adenylyltransferase
MAGCIPARSFMAEPLVRGGGAITVGTFDGVHRGHVALLVALRSAADRLGLPAVVVTFDPHPLQVVRPADAPRLLSTREDRIELFAQLGVDRAVFLRFDHALAALPPERFVRDILADRLGVRYLVTGYDHGFGRDRTGDADLLRRIGRDLGFDVEVVPPLEVEGAPASSSRVRKALVSGDVEAAAAILGRPYSVRGTVVRGDGRGRSLGFPTANLAVPENEKLIPQEGIYVVHAGVEGELRDGVMHIGPRPTFPGAPATLELHLLDYSGNLYGSSLEVRFCRRLRGIERFSGESTLVAAMHEDVRRAREVLSAGSGACGENTARLD